MNMSFLNDIEKGSRLINRQYCIVYTVGAPLWCHNNLFNYVKDYENFITSHPVMPLSWSKMGLSGSTYSGFSQTHKVGNYVIISFLPCNIDYDVIKYEIISVDVMGLHFKVSDFIGPVSFWWHSWNEVGNIGVLLLWGVCVKNPISSVHQ